MIAYSSILWSQLRIGLVVSLAVTASAVMVFFIDEFRDAIEDRYSLVFHTSTTQALRPRAAVWLAGQPVGYVRTLTLEAPNAERAELLHVELRLSTDVSRFITEGAAAQVTSSSLLGEPIINIIPSSEPGAELTDGDELPAMLELDPFQVSRNLQVIYDSVVPVADRWREVFQQMQSGDGTLPQLLGRRTSAEALGQFQELAAVFDTIRRLGPRMEQLKQQWSCESCSLGQLAADTVLAPRLATMAETVARIRDRLAAGQGTAGRLLHDRALADELAETRQMLRELKADLAELGGGTPSRR
jgi:phospholipid/cholesterol/gamma-HCH transport system substrate-binding protein